MNIENLSEYIIYEDDHFICINKKAGLLSQPGKSNDVSLQKLLESVYNCTIFLINRLDRPVSGLCLFAKTRRYAGIMSSVHGNERTKKTYLAITENKPDPPDGKLENYLIKKGNKTCVVEDLAAGKKSVLKYKYLKSSENYFFIEIELLTGRFHQIRAQLSNIKCFIKGDVKYGARRSNADRSIGLHAWKLEFIHPVSFNKILLEAPLPEDNIWKSFSADLK